MNDHDNMDQVLDKLPELSLAYIEAMVKDWCDRKVLLPIGATHFVTVYLDKRRADVRFLELLLTKNAWERKPN